MIGPMRNPKIIISTSLKIGAIYGLGAISWTLALILNLLHLLLLALVFVLEKSIALNIYCYDYICGWIADLGRKK
jgi:hypothetical protein